MTNVQRIIKYLAIAFAFFLIFNILSAITFGISSFTRFFDTDEVKENLKELKLNENINYLDVSLKTTSLKIKSGKFLRAETNNKYINVKQDNNKLFISENNGYSLSNKNNDLVIYIPNDLLFDLISVSAGAGKINIDSLSAKKLSFELGAGNTSINNLNVDNKAKIEGGVGRFEILGGTINNLDLELGVGESVLNAEILGKSSIEAGVGSVKLNLNGNSEKYKIDVEKGIGSIKIDGETVKNESIHGNGINTIHVEGGIGSIDIKHSSQF